MNLLQSMAANVTTGTTIVLTGIERRVTDRERGDVPGWVLITLMTAGLVTALWTLASAQLTALFTQAMDSVSKR
jgi:hypothetical protein